MNVDVITVAARRAWIMAAVLCVLGAGLGSTSGATETEEWAAEHPDALSITLSTDKPKYKLGSDVLVTIRQKNVSPVIVVTSLLSASTDYDLFIDCGSLVMKSGPLGSRTGPVVMAPIRPNRQGPGTTVVERGTRGNYSPISDWGLKIEKPGTCVITAIERETRQKSNPVTITVTP